MWHDLQIVTSFFFTERKCINNSWNYSVTEIELHFYKTLWSLSAYDSNYNSVLIVNEHI